MLSLYRRHRPKTFDEVVGQENVVRTLRNAIDLGKVHHAYLFVGSRGTGKTSMAKLLACALNAEGGTKVDFDPAGPVSRAIMEGTSLDVVEMDAASNNSVDDIRELRENVSMAPMGGARRVYILDEAHMLSTAAWNAFLKTLEEPPSHVVFVLATTEAHKVPATIVDRCHRFDFQRPSLEQIADVVKRVADQEGVTIPDPAVGMIARKAAGSFRDALGTLEQLVTYGGNDVALEDVMATLGVADAELILDTAETLIDRDPRGGLLAVQRLTASGRDETRFMRDLAAHLRHLYVIQTMGEVPDSFAVTAAHTDRLKDQAGRLPQAEIVRTIDLLATALASVKEGAEPRLQLEVALLKATQPQVDQSLQALMRRLDRIEAGLGQDGEASRPSIEEPPPAEPPSPESVTSAPPEHSAPTEPEPPTAAPQPSVPAEPEPRPSSAASPSTALGGGGSPSAAAAAAQPEASASTEAPDLARIVDLWIAVTEAIMDENAMVAALLVDATPALLEDGVLTVHFPADAVFSKKKAEANRELIANALRGLSGHRVQILFELSGEPTKSGPAVLTEDELAERLKRDYGAEEIFDDDSGPEKTED